VVLKPVPELRPQRIHQKTNVAIRSVQSRWINPIEQSGAAYQALRTTREGKQQRALVSGEPNSPPVAARGEARFVEDQVPKAEIMFFPHFSHMHPFSTKDGRRLLPSLATKLEAFGPSGLATRLVRRCR
jgi:hypothetical protein